MTTIMKLFFSILKILCIVLWKILKVISVPMRDSLKDLWKMIKKLYKLHKEKKAAMSAASEAGAEASTSDAPDNSVRITGKDEFENLTDEDLNLLLQKMTDLAVKVDLNPELEKVYETYGADSEIFKQKITDELKRRAAKG